MRILIGLILTFASLCQVRGDDWYRFRGPTLNGISNETDWSHDWGDGGPKSLWKTNVGTGLSGVVVSDRRAYTIGNADDVDTVYCLNATTGDVIWRYEYDSPVDSNEFEGGPTSTPTIDQEHVFSMSRLGDVFCFDKVTGELIWHTNAADAADVRTPGWGFAGSPLIIDRQVLLNVGDAGVALEKATGKFIWGSSDKDAGYSSMVPITVNGNAAVVFGSARSYVCVEAKSGKEIWRQRWLTTFGCNAADPILAGERIFLSSGYNRGSALIRISENPPEVLWKNKDMQNQISSCVLINGFLFGIHGDVDAGTKLRCMELETGMLKWSVETFHPGAISAAGDRLIILTNEGELVIVKAEPQSCIVLARYPLIDGKCWTAPVISNGQIYCRSVDGELVCIAP